MRWFWKIRVRWKLLLRRTWLIPSFCKRCGRDVRDFIVSDRVWERVSGDHTVLCYECWSDLCVEAGLCPVWKLEEP